MSQRERPILFSGPMVRAILDGRKTVTRRVVTRANSTVGSGREWAHLDLSKAWPELLWGAIPGLKAPASFAPPEYCPECVDRIYPRWEPGDRLWVRETLKQYDDNAWYYAADMTAIELDADDPRVPAMVSWAHHVERDYCPSIHMPRWASRITLEVASVRAERLQEVTEADAIAEGVAAAEDTEGWPSHALGFIDLWDTINAKRGHPWESNPFVWRVEFRRIGP